MGLMDRKAPANNNDRRVLLHRMLQWSGIILSAILLYPLSRFLGFTVKAKPRHINVAAPLPLSGYHAEREFILFRGSHGKKPFAVSRTCTHLGCRVSYLEDKKIIECPCHQSRFTPTGKVVSGPAKKDLASLPVHEKKDATGQVLSYVVTL